MIEENHEKTPVRLVGTGTRTRDFPNAILMCYHGATSLGFIHCLLLYLCLWCLTCSDLNFCFRVLKKSKLHFMQCGSSGKHFGTFTISKILRALGPKMVICPKILKKKFTDIKFDTEQKEKKMLLKWVTYDAKSNFCLMYIKMSVPRRMRYKSFEGGCGKN